MQKLDKKQIPQFAALCVLSAGVFGYFIVKIVVPSPAAAGTRPRPAPVVAAETPVGASPAKAATASTTTTDGTDTPAPAPTPGMRDPFAVGFVDPALTAATTPTATAAGRAAVPEPAKDSAPQVATIREVSPAPVSAPGLQALPPGLQALPPMGGAPGTPDAPEKAAPAGALLPAPTPAPLWAVTGVLQSPGGSVAILRNGDARRIVRNGDSVDGLYRVVAVTRSAVMLRHGNTFYHLALGADKPGAGKPGTDKSAAPAPARPTTVHALASVPAMTSEMMPLEDAQAPTDPPAGPAQVIRAALMMARSYMTPAQMRVDACLASLRAPSAETARAAFDLDRDLYAAGQDTGGDARWVCALATAEHDRILPAVKPADLTL